jgi:hypothetical protein
MTPLLNRRQILVLHGNGTQGRGIKLLQGDRDSCISDPNQHNGPQKHLCDLVCRSGQVSQIKGLCHVRSGHGPWALIAATGHRPRCIWPRLSADNCSVTEVPQTGASAKHLLEQNQEQSYRTLVATGQLFHDEVTRALPNRRLPAVEKQITPDLPCFSWQICMTPEFTHTAQRTSERLHQGCCYIPVCKNSSR